MNATIEQRVNRTRRFGAHPLATEVGRVFSVALIVAAAVLAAGCGAPGVGAGGATENEITIEPVSPTALAVAEAAAAAADETDDAMEMATADEAAAPDRDTTEPVDHSDPNHTHDDEAAADSVAVRFGDEVFGANTGDYGSSFTPDGGAVFFTRALPDSSNEAIYLVRRDGGRWGEPELAPFSGEFHDKEPYVAPDGSRVYFASRRPVRGTSPRDDLDIWYVESTDGGWGDPVHVDAVSSAYNDDYPAVAADGTLVFARNDDDDDIDLWIAYPSGEGLGRARRFARPINSVYAEADPWIAADGNKIVFSSPRLTSTAQGQGDLYVIHRLADGWTPAASLGVNVNSIAHEYGPELSPRGDAFYFSRGFGGRVWTVPVSALENFDGTAAR